MSYNFVKLPMQKVRKLCFCKMEDPKGKKVGQVKCDGGNTGIS